MMKELFSCVELHWSQVVIGLEVVTKQYIGPWMFEVTHSFFKVYFYLLNYVYLFEYMHRSIKGYLSL